MSLTPYQVRKLKKLIENNIEAAINNSWKGTYEARDASIPEIEADLLKTHNDLKRYIASLSKPTKEK